VTPLDIPPECEQAQKDILEIESGLSKPESVFHRTLLNKGELLRLLAASYEVLSTNNLTEIPVNGIANHIMKRITQLNTNLSKAWVYDSLPSKYKSHRANISTEIDESSKWTENSSLYTDYEKENVSEIEFYKKQIELCKKIISHLKTEPYLLKTDYTNSLILDFHEYESDLVIRNAAQDFVFDTFDNRKSVPLNTIHLLIQAYFDTSNKYAAGVYISKLKEYGIQKKDNSIQTMQKLFTPKQLGKILKGETKQVHQSFEIITEADAWNNGFYGKTNCPECGDKRIRLEQKYDYTTDSFSDPMLHCYACLKDSEPPKIKMPMSHPTVH